MSAPASSQSEIRERILTAVRDVKTPVTFKSLAQLVKAKKENDEPFRAALESAVAAGEVYPWPEFRRSKYFWHVSPDQKAREVILTAVDTCALSKSELSKAAARSLPGFSVKRVDTIVSALAAEKELQAVPPFTGRAKLLVRTGDREAYLNAARSFVDKKIRSAGFDVTPVARVDAAALILEVVRSLEPVRGVPVSTLRLRNHLPNLTKPEFDTAAMELRRKQEVFLSQHADPYNLSQEDKNLLIDGQDGTYYVAIAIR